MTVYQCLRACLRLAFSVAVLAMLAVLQSDAGEVAAPTSQQAPAQQQGVAKLNSITTAFSKAGAKRCLGRVEQIDSALTSGKKSGIALFLPTEQQDIDNRMLSLSMESASGDGFSYANTFQYSV